jgi:hypothetical protein
LTPGLRSSSVVKLRPCIGSSRITLSSMTWPSSAVARWSSGDSPTTVTDSLTVPTSSLALRLTVSFTPTTNGAIFTVRSPWSSIVSR